MNVRVVLFAKPRELVGKPNVELALPVGATAADAWNQLSSRYDLGPLPRSFRCAVNSEYAGWEAALKDGDELAVISTGERWRGRCRAAAWSRSAKRRSTQL